MSCYFHYIHDRLKFDVQHSIVHIYIYTQCLIFLLQVSCLSLRVHQNADRLQLVSESRLESVSRLDAPTSGALVVPLSSKAVEELKSLFATRAVP